MKIHSIYLAIDGEATIGGPGQWTTIVRLGGCNLRCWKSTGFCDAPTTLDINYPYPELTIDEVVGKVRENCPCNRVLITGGEPLMQLSEVISLAQKLWHSHFVITLETSGSIDLPYTAFPLFSCIIADIKPPSTEMSKSMKPSLFNKLRKTDFIKAALQNESDYKWSLKFLNELSESEHSENGEKWYGYRARVVFGPRYGFLEHTTILDWLKRDKRFDIGLNFQLHKWLWPDKASIYAKDLKFTPEEREKIVSMEC